MNPPGRLTLFIAATLLSSLASAQSAEESRLRGFAQHQKEQSRFEKAREQGERAYLEEVEQWENEKERQLDSYKRGRKKIEMPDDGPEARADAAAKKKLEQDYEESRRDYMAKRVKRTELPREALNLPSEKVELGLIEERPRYDYRKRATFGAKPKYGKSASGSSGGSSGSFGGSSSPSFPPSPVFDDFGGDGGYVPAPNLPEDFGDVPPPPPPPPPPFGDDFGGGFGGDMGDGDFPPPPPPPFEGENNF